MKKKYSRKRGEAGFTLIEALIVLIILGILTVTAIPYYQNMQSEARIAVTKGSLSAIRGGIELAHAKILASGVNTGTSGSNPDWPTLQEVKDNRLSLITRPASIRNQVLVRSNSSSTMEKTLVMLTLQDMTDEMEQYATDVRLASLSDIQQQPRRATETTGWAYYPGNERDANGRVISAVLFVNDDRSDTANVDSNGLVPSMW